MALYPALFAGCSATASEKHQKAIDPDANSDRLRLISLAMLAPNSHNIQPWLIKLRGLDAFDLYVDRDRLLPKTDPPARQIHISQGTFLEYLKIAASGEGYRVDIDYFPEGAYGNTVIEDKPVARVQLIRDQSVKADPLFPWLRTRQSNKRVYRDRMIPESELDRLRQQTAGNGFETVYSASPELLNKLGPMLGKAMKIETDDPERNKETVDIFRFSEEEAKRKRDGFTLANNGVTGLTRFFAETFFLGTREEAYATDSAFAREGVKMTYKQAESATAYGWIVSSSNTRLDQVKAGELYSRVNLLTAQMGLAQHPLSQILEEYDDMQALQQECLQLLDIPQGHTVQMLYRLGYAEPVPQTLRRYVTDAIA